MLLKRDRRLGSAKGKRLYDIPLNKSDGTGFLVLLIGLMTFLLILTLSGAFSLGHMAQRWSSGLENNLSIEIPAETSNGKLRSQKGIQAIAEKITKAITSMESVRSAAILKKQDIHDLISPWLGEGMHFDDLPLPGIISVQLKESSEEIMTSLGKTVKQIDEHARLDAHEEWLDDVLHFTGGLQLAAILTVFLIGFTTLTAIAGGVRSRMAIHRKDVELLHLMGARDSYIARQFQRHALLMSLKGSIIGFIAAVIALVFLQAFAGDSVMVPQTKIGAAHILGLLSVPACLCLLASASARFTVLRTLTKMP